MNKNSWSASLGNAIQDARVRNNNVDWQVLRNRFLHKTDEEIFAAATAIKTILKETVGGDFENLPAYKNFRSQAIQLSWKLREENPNVWLLNHIRVFIQSWEFLENMIRDSWRFEEADILAAKKMILLHDAGRLLSHDPILHQQFEAYRWFPNTWAEKEWWQTTVIESDYGHFDAKKAKELSDISHLFSLIDTFAKQNPDGTISNPLDFFGIDEAHKDVSLSDSFNRIMCLSNDQLPRHEESWDNVHQAREKKLKMSLLYVLKDIDKNYPQFEIHTRRDLEEKIVIPLSEVIQASNVHDFFDIQPDQPTIYTAGPSFEFIKSFAKRLFYLFYEENPEYEEMKALSYCEPWNSSWFQNTSKWRLKKSIKAIFINDNDNTSS